MKKSFKPFLILGAVLLLGLSACNQPNPASSVPSSGEPSSEVPSEPGTVAVESISLSHTSHTMKVGDTFQLVATVYPENATNKTVTWTVLDGNDKLFVSNDGTVVAMKEGVGVVSATTADGGKQAVCAITVEAADPGSQPSEPSSEEPGSSEPSSEEPSSSEPSSDVPSSSEPSSEEPSTPVPSTTRAKAKTAINANHRFTFDGAGVSDIYYIHVYEDIPNVYQDVCQIEYVIDIDFGGMNNAQQYYGGEFGVGANGVNRIQEQWSDASGFWNYADADTQPDGAYRKGTLSLWFDVTNLAEEESMYLLFTYAAKSTFNVTLRTVNLYHTEGYTLTSQKINTNTQLIKDTNQANIASVQLAQLTSTNPFSYIDLELSYTAAADYAGGVVWVEGIYNEGLTLPNAPRNSVNIGKPMAPGAGNQTVATVRVYLQNYCAVDPSGLINFKMSWAPASDITLKSVTFHQLNGSGGQGGGAGQDVVLDDTFLSETQSPLEEKLTMDNIKTAMANSLVSKGNNYLLKNAISKMQNGENTTIAYIGGSITEGDNMPTDKITDIPGRPYSASWAYWSYKFLANKYGTGSNVNYHNAGMSGTGSDLGVARFQKDVLDANPNIIFIEFAVNNGETQIEKETYESMIRMALKDPNKPAVVLAMSWTGYSGGNVERYMTKLGEAYGLPVISIHKGLNQFKSQIFNHDGSQACWCSNDNLHPSLSGHKLYAKLIGYGITEIAKGATNEEFPIPSATYSDKYETMELYQRGDAEVSVTGFDTTSQTYVAPTNKSHQVSGQGGWKLNGGNGTLSMSTTAKTVFVLYCANQYDGSNGTVNVTVSGGHTANASATLPKDAKNQPGWGQICVIPVLMENTAANCTINVSFAGTGQIIGIAVGK